jgi:hypothetical protein
MSTAGEIILDTLVPINTNLNKKGSKGNKAAPLCLCLLASTLPLTERSFLVQDVPDNPMHLVHNVAVTIVCQVTGGFEALASDASATSLDAPVTASSTQDSRYAAELHAKADELYRDISYASATDVAYSSQCERGTVRYDRSPCAETPRYNPHILQGIHGTLMRTTQCRGDAACVVDHATQEAWMARGGGSDVTFLRLLESNQVCTRQLLDALWLARSTRAWFSAQVPKCTKSNSSDELVQAISAKISSGILGSVFADTMLCIPRHAPGAPSNLSPIVMYNSLSRTATLLTPSMLAAVLLYPSCVRNGVIVHSVTLSTEASVPSVYHCEVRDCCIWGGPVSETVQTWYLGTPLCKQ